MKWIFLLACRDCSLCLFGLFYYFVTPSYNLGKREGIIKEVKSLGKGGVVWDKTYFCDRLWNGMKNSTVIEGDCKVSLCSSSQQPFVIPVYVKCNRLQPRIEPVTYNLSPALGTARPCR